MVKSTNIMGSGASGISNISSSSHNHGGNNNNNNNNSSNSNNNGNSYNYNGNAGNSNYAQNGVAGLASISGLMSANNFIGHRRAGSSGGSSIGNGSNPNNGMVLDANATMRRKPRVAVSAQMEYRPRPNSMVNGYPPNANINHSATSPPQNANYPASGRPTSIILGNGPMPNSGVNNIMPRYDTHRRTPSAPRIQGVVGSLNPTSPQSPRFGSGSFPPHSPSHSPRSGSPCSPELMVNGGRLVAGGIYSAGGAYENGSELDYDGDRSAVSGIDMRTTGFQHGRTGSADMPMVRLAKTSGARVSRGNIIEIGAMSLAAAGDISDQYNSDILDDDDDGDRDEEDAEDDDEDEDDDDDVDDIGTKSDHELASDRDEGDHFRDDIDSDLEIDQHRDNDMTPLDSPQSRARQMLQGPFARPRAFSETGRQSDSGESELSNGTRLSVRTDIPLSRNHYNAHPIAYNIGQQQVSPPHLRSPNRPRPKSMVVSNVAANNDAESDITNNEAIEARTTRKVLDLEISNKSLLAINQTLEQDLRKKTAEMEELKQKMRRANLEDIFGIKPNEEGELSGGESTSVSPEGLTEEEVTEDIPFQRVCALIELMRREATAALEFTAILPGGRVLTAEELEDNLTEPNESTLPETLPCTDDVAMTSLDPIESTSDVTSQPVPSLQDTSSHTTATLTSNSTGSTRVRELLNVLAQRAIANDHGATTTTTTTTTHLSQEGTVNTTAIISELETLLLTENTATRATTNTNTSTSTRKSSKGDTTRPGGNHHHSPPSSRPPTRVPGPSEMRRGQSSQQTGVGTTTTSTSTRTFESKRTSSGGNTSSTRGGRQAAAAAASSNGNNNNNTTTTNTSYTPRRTPSSRTRPNNATSTTVNRATSLTASTARAK